MRIGFLDSQKLFLIWSSSFPHFDPEFLELFGHEFNVIKLDESTPETRGPSKLN